MYLLINLVIFIHTQRPTTNNQLDQLSNKLAWQKDLAMELIRMIKSKKTCILTCGFTIVFKSFPLHS